MLVFAHFIVLFTLTIKKGLLKNFPLKCTPTQSPILESSAISSNKQN